MSERYAWAIDGVAHIVKTETPTAGVGILVTPKCTNPPFHAARVVEGEPDDRHLCEACRAHLQGWTFQST